jgi:hypothetical protein
VPAAVLVVSGSPRLLASICVAWPILTASPLLLPPLDLAQPAVAGAAGSPGLELSSGNRMNCSTSAAAMPSLARLLSAGLLLPEAGTSAAAGVVSGAEVTLTAERR